MVDGPVAKMTDDTLLQIGGGEVVSWGELQKRRGFASQPPDFVPAHKLPAWISSADLHDEIRKLADEGLDKAACWDFTQAIYRLTQKAFDRLT